MSAEYDLIDANEWASLASQSSYATPFHEYEWNRLMAESFRGEFEGYATSDGDRQYLVPVYRHLPWLNPDEAQTSLIGYGGPLPLEEVEDGAAELKASIRLLASTQHGLGISAITGTLYPADFWPKNPNAPGVTYTSTCRLDVDSDANSIFNTLITGNARTAIRKSVKNGVVVREAATDDDIKTALELLRNTQESVGSYYQTEAPLFQSITELSGPAVNSSVLVAEVDEAMVAMAVSIRNKRELFHLFHGWDRSYAWTNANQALHWHMITQAADLEIPVYNMGESHTEELQRAKLRWGGHLELVPKVSLSF